jgi:hypothetical protein
LALATPGSFPIGVTAAAVGMGKSAVLIPNLE